MMENKEIKPIKIIKTNAGTFWNVNDGTETYSKDLIKLLDYFKIKYEVKEE